MAKETFAVIDIYNTWNYERLAVKAKVKEKRKKMANTQSKLNLGRD